MPDISERLQQAIEQSDEVSSIRGLHRELTSRGLFITTPSTVHRYVKGEVALPPMEFLEGAGMVLGVRTAWLATGDGRPRIDRVDHDAVAQTALLGSLPERLQQHLTFEYRQLGAAGVKLGMAFHDRSADRDVAAAYQRAGELLGECIAAPLELLGVDIGVLDGRTVRAYVSAMATAIELVAEDAGSSSSGEPSPGD